MKMLPLQTTAMPPEEGVPFWVLCFCILGALLIGYGFGQADGNLREYQRGYDVGYKQCVFDTFKIHPKFNSEEK
jgi:hypothetical protein